MTQYQTLLQVLGEMEAKAGVGDCYLVGGCVRDAIMNGSPEEPNFEFFGIKDFDVECFGVDIPTLICALEMAGCKVDLVGQSFGIIKASTDGFTYDFSVPRRERKVGEGYTGFEVEVDPTMTIKEAAERRDLTINAIYFSPGKGMFYDPFAGIHHIEKKIL